MIELVCTIKELYIYISVLKYVRGDRNYSSMSKAIPNAILVLRIFTLAACVASGVFLILDNFTVDGDKTRFQDIIAFRYIYTSLCLIFIF